MDPPAVTLQAREAKKGRAFARLCSEARTRHSGARHQQDHAVGLAE
jgi:hypothetical protein